MKKILLTHKPVISDVFLAVQGYEAVVIHYPIMIDGRYDGSIAYLISFSELLNKFSHIFDKSERDVARFILSSGGIILHSDNYLSTLG